MRKIRYSVPLLASLCLVFLLMIIAGAAMMAEMSEDSAFVGFIFLLLGILGLPAMVRNLFAGGVILEYDDAFITFHGIFKSKTLHWCQVERIHITRQGGRDPKSNRVLKLRGPFSVFGSASITERLLVSEHQPLEKLEEELLDAFEGDHAENILTDEQLAHVLPASTRKKSQPPQPVSAPQQSFGSMPDTRSRGVIGETPGAEAEKRGLFGRRS